MDNYQKNYENLLIPTQSSYVLPGGFNHLLKRVFDILFSLFALILLSPFFAIIALKIKSGSPGPVIYRGVRAGKDGKPFEILKFRTMHENPESYQGPKVTANDDSRITPFGKWLRKTKVNELPQLINVFKGEMSFVGPRPEDIHIVEGWPDEIREEILSVKPGITSPASILYRNEEELLQSTDLMDKYLWEILPSKMRLDQLYVRHQNFFADLDVILWTAIFLIPKLKEIEIPRHLLFAGPFSRFTYHYLGWFLSDTIVSFLAIGLTGVIWRIQSPFDLGLSVAIPVALLMAIFFSFFNFLLGLSRVSWSESQISDIFVLAVSILITTMALVIVNLNLLLFPILPTLFILSTGLLSFIGFVLFRYRRRLFSEFSTRLTNYRSRSIQSLIERVIIVGCEETAQFAAQLLHAKSVSPAFALVGFVDDNPLRIGMQVNGTRIIGEIKDVKQYIQKYDVGLVMFAKSGLTRIEQEEILASMDIPKSNIIVVPDMIRLLQNYYSRVRTRDKNGHIFENTIIDLLTGSYIWDHFVKLSEREIQRTVRYNHPLSLVYFKVDFSQKSKIKVHNTVRYKVIRSVTQTIFDNIRSIDLMGRVKDDEFMLLLPETKLESAQMIADRMRNIILNQPIDTEHGPIPVNLKLAVSSINEERTTLGDLIKDLQQQLPLDIKEIEIIGGLDG